MRLSQLDPPADPERPHSAIGIGGDEHLDRLTRFCRSKHLANQCSDARRERNEQESERHGELHPHARLAAEASEAAALQGKFWGMHDLLYTRPKALEEPDLVHYAVTLGLDAQKFSTDLHSPAVAKHVRDDEVGGAHSSIITTPTFFINGTRFNDTPDLETLGAAILAAS